MLESRQRMTSEEFYHRLEALRSEINTVPEQHREALRAGADKAQEQHERMRRTSASIEDMVADLGLIVEHTKFHLAVCRRELRELDPEGRLQIQATEDYQTIP
jgi:hypothetical protein